MKMFLCRFLLIAFLSSIAKSETFKEFYSFVKDSIAASNNYILPKNNEKSYATTSCTIKEYGSYDFIIVGGGSAGSLLAGRLAEILEWDILLLEAGENQTEFSDIPAFAIYTLNSEKNWGYYSTPQTTVCLGMVENKCVFPRGKVLGGSAAINGLINARGIPSDFDDWVKLGNPGWSYKDVLPFFKSLEKVDFPNANPNYYGQKGYLHVNFTTPPSVVADAFLNANIQKGLPKIDYNGKDIKGVSRVQFHVNGRRRDNSAHAFVDPVQNSPNLDIVLKAYVTRIILNKKKAVGVEFVKNGQKYNATVRNEVILSAGAINSPQILLLSGIGPAKELLALGIKPLVNLPAVGKHLKDHPLFGNLYFRTNKTAANLSPEENLRRYIAGLTPFTNGLAIEQIAFLNTNNNSASLRDIELFTFPPPLSVPQNPKSFFNYKDLYTSVYSKYNTLTDFLVAVMPLKPKSEGSVTLKSKSPLDFPNIDLRYFSDTNNKDIETMYQGIKYALSLANTSAFKNINAVPIAVQPECEQFKTNGTDRDYWYCAIRHSTTTCYHPTGTTRMGKSTKNSVVDTNLKVHKIKKLRVVDAGVMPNLNSGHTNAPTYMIAEKISHQIKVEYDVI